ncbi:unnamed protein product [Cyclocybe aegerita]|uniref:F-box domain-containing protein n=1 Tax=Cyclocybe aegerita TaxID=1973307 RepID=A0A8S0VRH3_CYCAE|nr:unnamed protein product [Cyclocybe aegerita]
MKGSRVLYDVPTAAELAHAQAAIRELGDTVLAGALKGAKGNSPRHTTSRTGPLLNFEPPDSVVENTLQGEARHDDNVPLETGLLALFGKSSVHVGLGNFEGYVRVYASSVLDPGFNNAQGIFTVRILYCYADANSKRLWKRSTSLAPAAATPVARRADRQLVRKRRDLKTKRNRHHDPLVRNLPLELLSRIFVFCQPDPPTKVLRLAPISPQSSWARSVGAGGRSSKQHLDFGPLSPSTLGATIYRRMPHSSPRGSHSGGLPLTVAIWESKGSEPEEGFGEADEDIDPSGLSAALKQLQYNSSCAPRLESLRIHGFPSNDSTNHLTFNEGSPFMPSPRNVFLSSMRPDSIFIRWNLVKCVNVSYVNPADLLTIFANAANISRVHIRTLTRDRDLPLRPVVHRAVRLLHFMTSQNIDDILNNLAAPSLRRLHVMRVSPSLTSMIARSKPPLTDMTIRGNIVWDEALRLFKHTPFLSELHLIDIAVVPRTFFQRLADTSAISPLLDGRYLPALSLLRIRTTQNSFVWKDIADAFGPDPLNAAATQQPLTAFLLHMMPTSVINVPDSGSDEASPLNTVALQRLRALRAGGFSVSIVDARGQDLLAEDGNGMGLARGEDEGSEEA